MLNAFDQFLQTLIRSGFATAEDLHGMLEGLPSEDPAADAETLAVRLIARGKLTRYQATALRAGQPETLVVGSYLVLEKLGAGGMGAVFKAEHRRMKRIVALKVLPGTTKHGPDEIERFQQEVEAVAALNHPNIVTAYDAGESALGPFLVMEFVEGSDLDAILRKRGPLPVAEALDAIIQAAEGLEYAHSQGVVHRDIKPANLLRDKRGTIKVTDLGLARMRKGLAGHTDQGGLTEAGSVFGTVDYMSPEQAIDSKAADHLSDVYSLGCTLYFVLTGHVLYPADSLMAKLWAHREKPIPSLCASRPDVSEKVDAVFRKLVAKQPQNRPPSMTEVVQLLEACRAEITASSAPLPQPARLSELRVVLAEPSRSQSLLIAGLVRGLGAARVDCYADGQSALHAMREDPPSCILCAMHLSDMTGLELLDALRAEPALRAVGFLLVSSEVSTFRFAGIRSAGDVAILPKPFNAEQLKLALSGTLPSLEVTATTLAPSSARVLLVPSGTDSDAQVQITLSSLGFTDQSELEDPVEAGSLLDQGEYDLAVVDYEAEHPPGSLGDRAARRTQPVLMLDPGPDPPHLAAILQEGVLTLRDEAFEPEAVGPVIARALAHEASEKQAD
jgi:serine/threonine-protein kinase